MAQEYGKFECPVCGKEIFVLLPLRGFDEQHGGFEEVTCPKGHTDTYDLAALKRLLMKPTESAKAHHKAMAAVG